MATSVLEPVSQLCSLISNSLLVHCSYDSVDYVVTMIANATTNSTVRLYTCDVVSSIA